MDKGEIEELLLAEENRNEIYPLIKAIIYGSFIVVLWNTCFVIFKALGVVFR